MKRTFRVGMIFIGSSAFWIKGCLRQVSPHVLSLTCLLLVPLAGFAGTQEDLVQAITENNGTTLERVRSILSRPDHGINFGAVIPTSQLKDNIYTLAARVGNVKVVKAIMKASKSNGDSFSINRKPIRYAYVSTVFYDRGRTPLAIAAENGHKDVVKLLIANKAFINLEGTNSPLYTAAENGHRDVVKLLLANKAEINTSDDQNDPINIAAKKGHEEIVKLLLAKTKVKAEALGKYHVAAAMGGHREIVQFLLDKGVNLAGKSRDDAFSLAAEFGHKEMVQFLLDKGVNASEQTRTDSLKTAARRGNVEMVQFLIDKGVNVTGRTGTDALEWAAQNGHKEVVQFLINKGVSLGGRTGIAALDGAAQNGHKEMVQFLLDKGVSVADNGHFFPLHHAAREGYKDVAKLLIDAGANVNANSGSALHMAVRYGNRDVVELLVEKGADTSIKRDGKSLFFQALLGGNNEIIKTLFKSSKLNIKNEIASALAIGRRDLAEKIVRLFQEDSSHSTNPLDAPAGINFDEFPELKFLAKLGCDIEQCPICVSPLGTEEVDGRIVKKGPIGLDGESEMAISITSCGHTFCEGCLENWLKAGHNTCPMCRNKLAQAKILPLKVQSVTNRVEKRGASSEQSSSSNNAVDSYTLEAKASAGR